MTLYEIDQAIQDALERAIDPDTGEIIDEQVLTEYDQLQMDRDRKVENIGLFIKDLEAEAKAIKEEAKSLTTRAKHAENKADRLRKYMEYCLAGEAFKSPRLSVSFRHGKKVEVDQNRLFEIPDHFLRYKEPEPDKKAISEALKAGEDIPGCQLVESISMIIK